MRLPRNLCPTQPTDCSDFIVANGNIKALNELIGKFMTLPGVGNKTAQRYALSVLKMSEADAEEFSKAIVSARKNVKFCRICGNFTEGDVCDICATRDSTVICVVKDPKDIFALERVRDYKGTYHVLGGVLNPLENVGPNDLRIKELIDRLDGSVGEVIIATNPDVEGEATAVYLSRLIKPLGVKVTRIARGVSVGSDLEYADEVTLSRAMEDRREM